MSKNVFSEITFKTCKIKNRFVRSATWEGMATEKGEVTSNLIRVMEELAKGEVGLIITSHAYVDKKGQASPWQLGVYSDKLIDGLKKIPETVHKYCSKIFLQIAHSGIFHFSPHGQAGIGPSDFEIKSDFRSAQAIAMTKDEIHDVVEKFAQAAKRAKLAGFDGVQIHAAHGYLLSQFLSPYFNKRQDEYGKDIKGRSKLLMDVYLKIREKVGEDFPVIVKINCEDFLDPQMTFKEMLYVSKLLQENGIDGIEMSGGTLISKDLIPSRAKKIANKLGEVYYLEHAKQFKQELCVPLILVGGIRKFDVCNELVKNNICDMVSMSRPFIRESHLIARWKHGDLRDALCESCNMCFKPALRGEGLYCYMEKKLKEKEKRKIKNDFKNI
ncbi:NADH:flavin oxidoreductase [Desulfothermus sp.]